MSYHTDNALKNAAIQGRIDLVRCLVDAGADVNATDNNGWTVLMVASDDGHIDLVRFLVEAGADVNATDNNGWTALMVASDDGHIDLVRFLVEAGADVNVTDNRGQTPLMVASYNGHIDVVRFLVEAGADVNATNGRGQTPLMVFAVGNPDNPEVFEFLESLSASQLRGSVVHAVPGDYTCPICRCHDGEEVFQLAGCVHQFHSACIAAWRLRVPTCPMCRAAI
jgi:hypothetical protein